VAILRQNIELVLDFMSDTILARVEAIVTVERCGGESPHHNRNEMEEERGPGWPFIRF